MWGAVGLILLTRMPDQPAGEEILNKVLLAVAAIFALAGCVPADRVGDSEGATGVQELQVKADMFGTSIELERGLYDCQQAHQIPADHAPDHPVSVPLAECVSRVYGVAK